MQKSNTIAIVDNHELVRDSLKSLLDTTLWDTELFESSVKFLARIDEGKIFKCAILDLYLEELNAIEIMEVLIEQDKNLPVVVLTAIYPSPLAGRVVELGAIEILQKPSIGNQIINIIKTLS